MARKPPQFKAIRPLPMVTLDPRASASQRGYDARWRRLRALALAMQPLCAECLRHNLTTAATEVHHIDAKRRGGLDVLENLESLCKSCHSRKTRQEGTPVRSLQGEP